MDRAGKEAVVEKFRKKFKDAKVAILADFRGLNVEKINDLRRELGSSGVQFTVIKNTLAKLAISGTDFEPLDDKFEGPIAIAFATDDVIAPAKILSDFIKKNEILKIMGGVLEGQLLDEAKISELAKLPSKDQLIGQLLSVMLGPVRNLAFLLNEIPRRLVSTIDGIRKQKE